MSARRYFEAALAHRYQTAGIDLADLMTNPRANMIDLERAKELYGQAWSRGLPIAGFRLGRLLETQGTSSSGGTAILNTASAPTLDWYRRAAEAGEPNALARLAELEAASAMGKPTADALDRVLRVRLAKRPVAGDASISFIR